MVFKMFQPAIQPHHVYSLYTFFLDIVFNLAIRMLPKYIVVSRVSQVT